MGPYSQQQSVVHCFTECVSFLKFKNILKNIEVSLHTVFGQYIFLTVANKTVFDTTKKFFYFSKKKFPDNFFEKKVPTVSSLLFIFTTVFLIKLRQI